MRFWAFHMMFVTLPSIVFMTYAQFQVDKIKTIEKKVDGLLEEAQKKQDESVYSSADYVRLAKKQKRLGMDKKKV